MDSLRFSGSLCGTDPPAIGDRRWVRGIVRCSPALPVPVKNPDSPAMRRAQVRGGGDEGSHLAPTAAPHQDSPRSRNVESADGQEAFEPGATREAPRRLPQVMAREAPGGTSRLCQAVARGKSRTTQGHEK